ncbi:hypothetical protein BS639_01275 [Rouxiella silvae]|uniref:DUF2384 domain-containing protein n=1 Tax=Rouxiella silvae TaxID=1646373 RepID=A0AA40X5Y3_9GAMM|nr:antitoxin Xre/MbcA/ParS toxin-binding domain-containing protein [Rouxiella silvae]KQN42867.1 hypothetical protein ASE93_19410 [Serratia sp. Leaf50]MBF6639261.1 DUF2384 domain-containing protein [Rouxiella silvae]ORJ23012.1 hypothetical protein BS639_01275 [Rouxiella silvae]
MKTYTPPMSGKEVDSIWKNVGLSVSDGALLVSKIDEGLEGAVATRIVKWAAISQAELRRMTGIPSTTFSRNIKTRFSPDQSERLVRFIRVMDKAVELFDGDKLAAQKWLNEPSRALAWKTPADLLASEAGAYEVMKLITRIEHGIYS